MQIYHYHPETHFFLGTSQADPSPLEPGMYLIPAFATTEPVPEFDPALEWVRWVGGVWQVEAIPEPEPEPDPIPEPEPPPEPDWDEFKVEIHQIWKSIHNHSEALSGDKAALQVWANSLPNPENRVPILIDDWNIVVGAIPSNFDVDWQVVIDAANNNNCPIFNLVNPETGVIVLT